MVRRKFFVLRQALSIPAETRLRSIREASRASGVVESAELCFAWSGVH